MPWREVSIMEQRREFVGLAMQEGANRRELCRRFGIHPDTAYKWDRPLDGRRDDHGGPLAPSAQQPCAYDRDR